MVHYEELPIEPPAYETISGEDDFGDDLEAARASQDSLDREIEEMEIEDSIDSHGPGLVQRAHVASVRLKQHWSHVQEPFKRILDPIAEYWAHLSLKADIYLARLGNPLIVKRFVYVIFISLVIYMLSFTGVFPQDGSSLSSSFSDHGALIEFIKDTVDLKNMEENLEYLSSIDHVAGTTGDLILAKFIHAFFKESNMNVINLDEMKTFLNFPNETFIKYDETLLDLTQQFNPLSFDGDVTSNLIYANYGYKSDFDTLLDNDVHLKGNIAIIRYDGDIPTSQKLLFASNYGIEGVLFISDNEEYPDMVQRKSVAIPQFYMGDPLSPGWSSSTINQRISLKDSSAIKIPTVSLSKKQSDPIMDKLTSGFKFKDGRFSGDGKSFQLQLKNKVTIQQDHSIWNVLGKIEGKERGEQAIIVAAQRDAICKGTVNPNTGTTILLELVQLFTKLKAKSNWNPLRSIYFISYDGGEYNYAGISELIEAKMREIRGEVIAYIDLTNAIAGDDLVVRSSGLLSSTVESFKKDFNMTVKKTFNEWGSFIPFMTEGVPVMTFDYEGADYPSDSCLDTFENFKEKKYDPGFKKHSNLVQLVMRTIISVIDDPLIPFDITSFVNNLDIQLKDLQKYAQVKRSEEQFDFNPIFEGLLSLKQIGKDLELWKKAWGDLVDEDAGVEPSLLSVHRWNWNSRLNIVEKSFLDQKGILGRKWFKNLLVGPQLFKPDPTIGEFDWFSFPGIRDAIDQYDKQQVQYEINRVGDLIQQGCKIIEQ